MKHLLVALSMAVGAASIGFVPLDAEAKRLGGGKSSGMQRQMPAKQADAPNSVTPAQAPGAQPGAAAATAGAAAPAAAGAAAAAGKRSWMGPIAGLAAGLGLAALFSHLGMGEGLANFVMIALLVVGGVFLLRWVMGRMRGGQAAGQRGGLQMAGAGAGAGAAGGLGGFSPAATQANPAAGMARSALQPANTSASLQPAGAAPVAAAAPVSLPGGMDPADFTRLAKQVFIRMQAANDAADVDDLRRFTTPELFASLKADLLERGSSAQKTDVVQLDAEVADVAQEPGRDVVSVRFSGLIREQADGAAQPFAEYWHLVRNTNGGDWAIAGIAPLDA